MMVVEESSARFLKKKAFNWDGLGGVLVLNALQTR